MPDKPNNPLSFWQELKRRKVVRVITVYAAAAFVIIELINNVYEPLRLPEWTPTLVIVLLIIGFIITVIVSWIYDIHPEGGIVKTEPAHKVKPEDIPKSSNSWRIASYISFVVIIGLIVLNIIPRHSRSEVKEILDKSIAVLPFRNESSDQENAYFINALMESVLDNLCKIKDLRVPGRTSTEQYRNNPKSIPEVAEELNVSYIIEGSGLKLGNRIVLTIQLIEGKKDQHLWSKQYDREIQNVEDLVDIQGEVAQLVAAEIEAIITPEEKQRIEKVPTTSSTAYDFYQRGREEFNRGNIERAEVLFNTALDYDSSFALAYTGLAQVYWNKHYWETYFTEKFMDSALFLADIALSIDNKLAEAHVIRGNYFRDHNEKEKAIIEYDKAIKFNPNEWIAYYEKGDFYSQDDLVKALENYHKVASLQRGPLLPHIYRTIGLTYAHAGFKETSIYYYKEALKLDDDSAIYYSRLAITEDSYGNFDKAVEFGRKSYIIDSTQNGILYFLGLNYLYLDQFEKSLEYLKKWDERLKAIGRLDEAQYRIGYAYWVNGFEEEGRNYINKELENFNELAELDRYYFKVLNDCYHLAAIYAFLGNKDKAYENLKLMNQRPRMPIWVIKDLKNDPMFDSIRDEPEFQQIVRDVETKYQTEHERVRKWLQENDML